LPSCISESSLWLWKAGIYSPECSSPAERIDACRRCRALNVAPPSKIVAHRAGMASNCREQLRGFYCWRLLMITFWRCLPQWLALHSRGPDHVGLSNSRSSEGRFLNSQGWRRDDLRNPGTCLQYLSPKDWIWRKAGICCPSVHEVSRLAPSVCKEVFRSTTSLPAGEPTAVTTRTKDRLQRQIPLHFQRSWDPC